MPWNKGQSTLTKEMILKMYQARMLKIFKREDTLIKLKLRKQREHRNLYPFKHNPNYIIDITL